MSLSTLCINSPANPDNMSAVTLNSNGTMRISAVKLLSGLGGFTRTVIGMYMYRSNTDQCIGSDTTHK